MIKGTEGAAMCFLAYAVHHLKNDPDDALEALLALSQMIEGVEYVGMKEGLMEKVLQFSKEIEMLESVH